MQARYGILLCISAFIASCSPSCVRVLSVPTFICEFSKLLFPKLGMYPGYLLLYIGVYATISKGKVFVIKNTEKYFRWH